MFILSLRNILQMNKKILSIFSPTSLQQRTTYFVLLPTLVILAAMGVVSMILIRDALLEQWQQTAIARLQQSAHYIDMRLNTPKRVLRLFREENGIKVDRNIGRFIIDQLREMDGVVQVNLEWKGSQNEKLFPVKDWDGPHMHYSRMRHLEITPPSYNSEFKNETISLITEFRDDRNRKLGHIKVIISFYDLIDQIVKASWWKSNRAFLVDQHGNILTRTSPEKNRNGNIQNKQFGKHGTLEQKTLEALRTKESGTVLGSGMPPEEVSGFYRLKEAPWTMVVITPGEKALRPIIQFRKTFILVSSAGILLALLLIRSATNKTTRAIRRLSEAAGNLAHGRFGEELRITSRDEVGELTHNFNTMSIQLQERLRLRHAMELAREVQQNLLPHSSFSSEHIDVCGVSLYCDETGGDYFDLLPHPRRKEAVNIIVGDVVGHGVGAALLMATIRALMRCRISLAGTPETVIGDVNRLLCKDTAESGNFITLFYLLINWKKKTLEWVRCGHDPAIIYYPETRRFSELKGGGLALGIEPDFPYKKNSISLEQIQQVILIGSDGVWETENKQGEVFGKERVKTLLAANSHLTPKQIIRKITDEIRLFRQSAPQLDDITLVIAKIGEKHNSD
jgi:sigma-B regulation protein RsbU (phosphoserine phosphatase)